MYILKKENKTMKPKSEQPTYIEERLEAIKRFYEGLETQLEILRKTSLSIAIREGKARGKQRRAEVTNSQESKKGEKND